MDPRELHFTDINKPENIDKIYLVLINTTPPRKFFVQYKGDNRFIYFRIEGQGSQRQMADNDAIFPNSFAANGDDVSFVEFNLPMDIFNKFFMYEAAGGKRKTYKKRRTSRRTKRNYKNKKVKR
jgi:hypothetical protein